MRRADTTLHGHGSLLKSTYLRSLTRRPQSDRTLLGQYNDIIQSQISSGIIKKIENELEDVNKKHYLPHHPPSKASTNSLGYICQGYKGC